MAPSNSAKRLDLIRGYLELNGEIMPKLDEFGPMGPIDIEGEGERSRMKERLEDLISQMLTFERFEKLLANKPPSDLSDEELADEKDTWKHYRGELTEMMAVTWSVAYLKADSMILPDIAKQCLKQSKAFEDKVKEFVYVPVDLEDAPPLPESIEPESDVDSDITVNAVKFKQGKKTKKPKTKLVLSGPPVDIIQGQVELPPNTSDDVEKFDNSKPVFVGEKKMIQLLYVPGHSVPTHKGKAVEFSKINEYPPAEIKWVQNSAEKFLVVSTLDTAVLSFLHDLHHVPTKIKGALWDKVTDLLVGEPKSLSEKEAVVEFGTRQVQQAKLIKYWALCEKHLVEAKLENKLPFVDKWMTRLADVPTSLDPSPCAFLLAKFLKQAKGDKTAINKTFFGFLNGNLASWKVGETRDSMIERCKKSLDAYWGSQASVYISEFLKTDDGKLLIKPKPEPMTRRLARLAKTAEQHGWKAYSEVTAGLAVLSEEAKQEFVEAQVLATGLPYRKRAAVYWSRIANFGGKVRTVVQPTASTVFTRTGNFLDQLTDRVYNLISGTRLKAVTGNGLVVNSWFKTTTYRFKKAMSKEAPTSWAGLRSTIKESGHDSFSIIVEDRPWWASFKSNASKLAWTVAAPIRWFGMQFNHSLNEVEGVDGGTE